MGVNWDQFDRAFDSARKQWADLAKPFPYCVFEGALEQRAAKQAAREFAGRPFTYGKAPRIEKHALNKRGGDWDQFTPLHAEIVEEFNSDRFVRYLARLTGMEGLQADPMLLGGGLHETLPGGYLNVHTDFNIHPKLRMRRALNLIVYLNEDWRDEWGGHLELWDEAVRHPIARFAPTMNRAVLFETNEISFHGHPKPLACPKGVTRRSMALYYYTPWEPALSARTATNYQLVPWQWAELTRQIADLIEQRIDTLDAVQAALIERWQSDDIETAYRSLLNLRTWTLHGERAKVEPRIEFFVLNPLEHRDWRRAKIEPNAQLKLKDGQFISLGEDPFFHVPLKQGARSFSLKWRLPAGAERDPPKFFFDFGEGTSESLSRVSPIASEGESALRVTSTAPIVRLRIDPMSRPCETPDFDIHLSE